MEMRNLLKLMEDSGYEDMSQEPGQEVTDEVDTVTVDIPLLIRMLEYAREDAQTDMDLHDVTEKMIELAKSGTLTMDNYDSIVNRGEAVEEGPVAFNQADGDEDELEAELADQEDERDGRYGEDGTDFSDNPFRNLPDDEEINENFGYGVTTGTDSDEHINYTQTKNVGNGTVTISANATNMSELHDMLKLAGISVDGSPAAPTSEPEVVVEPEQPAPLCGCGSDDADVSYSTDKQEIADKLRSALQARLG